MALSSYVSVITRDILMGTPCFLKWLRMGTAGWEPTGRSSSSGGMRDSTHAWKNPTELALLAIISAYSLRSEEVTGASGEALSSVGGVGRYKTFFV